MEWDRNNLETVPCEEILSSWGGLPESLPLIKALGITLFHIKMQCYLILCLSWMLWVLQKRKKVTNINVSCWNNCFDCHAGLGVHSVTTQGIYPVEQMRMDLSGVRALFLPSTQLFRALGGTGQTVSFCGTSFKSCWKWQDCPSPTVLVFSRGSKGQRHL